MQITKFAPGNTQILSCSDDKTVRIWDIPGQEPVSILEGHQVSVFFFHKLFKLIANLIKIKGLCTSWSDKQR